MILQICFWLCVGIIFYVYLGYPVMLERVDEVINVRTKRLDSYLAQKSINKVSLIKIDVEGYEYYVLKGLSDFLKKQLASRRLFVRYL